MPGLPPGAGARPALNPQQQAALLQQQQAHFAAMMQNPAFRAQLLQQQQMAMAAAQGGGAAAAAKPAAAAAKPAATAAPAAAAATPAVQAVQAIPARKPGAGKKRKADARLAERGDLLIPDSQLFTQLQDAERRVDMLISRKKHELQEMYASFRRGPPGSAQAAGSSRKKLRMYIRSEHYHQQNAADAAEPPSWTLLINGRLLGKASEAEEGHHHKHHFTHYLRRVEIQLDPAQVRFGCVTLAALCAPT
jgi:SWI/SNF-related matrix-associated actin-dependent regulator of chromatin subfamily D